MTYSQLLSNMKLVIICAPTPSSLLVSSWQWPIVCENSSLLCSLSVSEVTSIWTYIIYMDINVFFIFSQTGIWATLDVSLPVFTWLLPLEEQILASGQIMAWPWERHRTWFKLNIIIINLSVRLFLSNPMLRIPMASFMQLWLDSNGLTGGRTSSTTRLDVTDSSKV